MDFKFRKFTYIKNDRERKAKLDMAKNYLLELNTCFSDNNTNNINTTAIITQQQQQQESRPALNEVTNILRRNRTSNLLAKITDPIADQNEINSPIEDEINR